MSYLPMLAISVAEMRGLEELPERDKDALLPYFQLRPWGVSHELENTLNRLTDAYGDRPFLADLCPPTVLDSEPRPVHHTLDLLRTPEDGYANWCDFLSDHPNMIPVAQLGDLDNLPAQLDRLVRLERGLGVYLPAPAFPRIREIARIVGEQTDEGLHTCVIIDLGQRGADLLGSQAMSVGLVNAVRASLPFATVAVSASSFPSDFVGLADQQIYERAHHQGVIATAGGEGVIFSDRGSARAQRQMGGGGTPAPRVDLAGPAAWQFFRDGSGGARPAGYVAQAAAAMRSDAWDANLRVWGVQMIERTAGGDRNAIKSPTSAAAARINMHLHQQLLFNDPDSLHDTDEEWVD